MFFWGGRISAQGLLYFRAENLCIEDLSPASNQC